MKRILALAAALALAACSEAPDTLVAPAAAPARSAAADYIVVLRDESFAAPRAASRATAVRDYAEDSGLTPRRVFSAGLRGFAARLEPEQVAALRADPRVAYVEPDAPARLFTTQFNATWGIDRIDQLNLPLSTTFTFGATGSGVTAYVLDTGIRRTHRQFGGRADYIANGANGDFVLDGLGSAEDCHGHGTHVAGTIGSATYGVAKLVKLRAGRVVNCVGNGTASMVIAAMDWIIGNGTKPAVVNMSLGYGDVQSVRDMAARLTVAGFFVVAAAGNGDFMGVPQDACKQAPAGAPSVLTVGATTSADAESSFSNYGTCVDLLAPGSGITSTLHGSDTAVGDKSGTSMAAPHAAGVAAQWLQTHPAASPSAVTGALLGVSVPFTITLHGSSAMFGTPNRFLRTTF